jgi:hypothetical protein
VAMEQAFLDILRFSCANHDIIITPHTSVMLLTMGPGLIHPLQAKSIDAVSPTPVIKKITEKNDVFWDVMPCDSCKNRRFGGTA